MSATASLPHRVGASYTDEARRRMRDRPVCGSAVLSTMPMEPKTRAAWSAEYPVALASARAARETTRWFLGNCAGTSDIADDAVLVTSELVANAVNAMLSDPKPGACVEVSWRVFPRRLLIEVTDSSPMPPIQKAPDATRENGNGLAAVNGLTAEWGFFWYHGRKVVYVIFEPIEVPSLVAALCDREITL